MKISQNVPRMLALAGLLALYPMALLAQQAKNVVIADLVSTETLYQTSSFPYNTADHPLADVWGWTYGGNEYALVCLGSKQESGSG